jgi:hypothetical protein
MHVLGAGSGMLPAASNMPPKFRGFEMKNLGRTNLPVMASAR